MQSRNEIQEAVSEYKEQLKAVKQLLQENPEDSQALEVQAALEDVLHLSQDILSGNINEGSGSPGISYSQEISAVAYNSETSSSVPEFPPLPIVHDENLSAEDNNRETHNADGSPNFEKLAKKYPTLQPYLKIPRRPSALPGFQWNDYNATRELTRVLLHCDYGLTWWIQDGQLCPTVPNRASYIDWLNELLLESPSPWHRTEPSCSKKTQVRGVDIGTGASCIYALLGAAKMGWQFLATDITDAAMAGAAANLKRNPAVAPLITLRQSSGKPQDVDAPVLAGVVLDDEQFDFCLCNPPFFETEQQAGANPRTACGGTATEMVYPGGEVAFITRIIHDSTLLGTRIHWYTSLVGRKASLASLKRLLSNCKVACVRTTEFIQGKGSTARWGLAWSFSASSQSLRAVNRPLAAPSPSASFMLQGMSRHHSALHVVHALETALQSLGAACIVDEDGLCLQVQGHEGIDSDVSLHNSICEPPAKRLHTSAEQEQLSTTSAVPSIGSVHREAGIASSNQKFSFRAQVLQQAPGSLVVTAAMPRSSSTVGMRTFQELMVRAEQLTRKQLGL